jgi:tetratricopeptide (TPR) repeat protein
MKQWDWMTTGLVLVLSLVAVRPALGQVDARAEAYYLYCLGRMYEMQGKGEESLDNYKKAIELDPDSAYPHLAMAELYAQANRIQDAVKSAQKAVELNEELAGAHRLLGNIFLQQASAEEKPELLDQSLQELKETVRLEPWDVDSRQRLSELYLMSGDFEEASEHLEAIIKQSPNSYYAMYRLAQIRHEMGDPQRAVELYREAIEVEPRHQASRVELGRVLTELREFEEAASVYRGALELAPDDMRLRVRLGYSLANSGELPSAAKEFERALERDPDNLEALLGLAIVRQNLKELDVAENLLKRALSSDSDNVRAHDALANIYQERREYQPAAKELEALLALPDEAYPYRDRSQIRRQRAEYLVQLGFAYQELNDEGKSVDSFRKARELVEGDLRFEVAYIQSLVQSEMLDEAEEALDRARLIAPENERLEILESQILFGKGQQQEAVEVLLAFLEKKPSDEMVIGSLVDLYQRQRRFHEAEQLILTTLESHQEDAPERVRLLFQLGAMLERQKKFDEAEEAFKEVLEKSPENAAALNYLGYMLADQGVRLDESLGYLKRAVAVDPYNGAYLDSLGWAYFKLGNLELAEENLKEAVKRLRLTGVVYDHLGDMYFEKGMLDEAIRSWRNALEQDDDELEKDKVKQKIERALEGQ